jgi:hypothetical protein
MKWYRLEEWNDWLRTPPGWRAGLVAVLVLCVPRALVDALGRYPTYGAFAGARQKASRKQGGRGPDWVLDELVGLIEHLARQRPQDGYREAVYAQVRLILGVEPAGTPVATVPPPREVPPDDRLAPA